MIDEAIGSAGRGEERDLELLFPEAFEVGDRLNLAIKARFVEVERAVRGDRVEGDLAGKAGSTEPMRKGYRFADRCIGLERSAADESYERRTLANRGPNLKRLSPAAGENLVPN